MPFGIKLVINQEWPLFCNKHDVWQLGHVTLAGSACLLPYNLGPMEWQKMSDSEFPW